MAPSPSPSKAPKATSKKSNKYVEPAPAQSDLHNFVSGAPKIPPRQKTLNAMFAKATGGQEDSEDEEGAEKMQVDPVKDVEDDTEMKGEEVASGSGGKKRVLSEAKEAKEEPSEASSSSKKSKPNTALGSTSPAKKDSKAAAPSNKKTKLEPAAASFFAPRSAAAAEGKGKGKSVDAEEGEGEDANAEKNKEEEDHEESDSDDDGEIGELAAILADGKSSGSRIKWAKGAPVPYSALTATFSLIDATRKRLEISALLTQFLVEVIETTPNDLLKTVYLCINRVRPDYEAKGELGLGEALLFKAIGEATGRTIKDIKAEYVQVGDLGEVAQTSRGKQSTLFKPKPLTVNIVYDTLKKVADVSGTQSQTKKIGLIKKLLADCVGVETKFLIRSLEGKLRIGLAERTILVSVAHAFVTAEAAKSGKKISKDKTAAALASGSEIVKGVFSELPSYDLVIPALLEKGVKDLHEACFLTPGIPLKPMLAKPTKAITDVLDRFEGREFTCEYKYDGERAQVHLLEDGSIKIFSRNSEDMSVKYPDIMVQLPAAIKEGVTSFVIDAEAVAWDPKENRLLPFQDLSRRKRKDVKAEDITVKVHLFAFDLLYLNGKPLLGESLAKRRQLLHESLHPVEGEFAFATSQDATDVEDIQVFLDDSVKHGCEGLMVKLLQGEGSEYAPSRRSIHWLKLKKDYLAGVGDSFDLVVIGGDYGRGKRTNVYGAFHLACYDPESDTYQAICKIGTGFSEDVLQSHYDFLHPFELAMKKPYYDVGTGKGPDVYFEPKMVWEVLAADLSLSPIYTAAKGLCGDGSRGISLRFPRYLRTRDDKDVNDATGPEQIAEAYQRQSTVEKGKKGGEDDGFW